jgi:signal transduction histidine kinase
MTTDIVDRLAEHKTIGSAPREELAWLAANATLRELATGDILSAKGVQVEGFFVLLSGRVAIFVDRGSGPQKIVEWVAGDVLGMLPYSRLVSPPGNSIVQEPSVILTLHRDRLPELIHACGEITSILVHRMLDRAREFTSSQLHDEKMVSLGKLSAGLAHELNNPAAAIERGASLLEDRLEDYEQAARALGAANLTESQLATVERMRNTCAASQVVGVRSPIEEAEREEAIADWLADRGLDTSLAEGLAETAVTLESLDELATAIDGSALSAALRGVAAGCSLRNLASEIQDAAMRISGLVTAIKGFTHMDRGSAAEPVDLAMGLNNTVAVLRSKARAKSVSVMVSVEPGLPRVRGFVGELNQVWSNLIDNALYAVSESGRIEVLAKREDGKVVVRVVDNGTGIPKEILDRIFEPFFTTKAVGLGTGLGLDIVRRLVRHNDGEIAVESQPGRTEFRVILPIDGEQSEGGNS